MARPIEPTILKSKEFSRIMKELENPKCNPAAKRILDEGERIHKRLLGKNFVI